MQDVIAPTMSERAMGIRSCVDERSHHQPETMNIVTLFLQMSAFVGVLVLLFAAQAVITVWNGCAWGTRSVRIMLTPAGRTVCIRMCSWGRAVQVFYLGTTASWTPSQASWTFTPTPSETQTRILELRKNTGKRVPPRGLLVLNGPRSATDQGRRAGGVGDAASPAYIKEIA